MNSDNKNDNGPAQHDSLANLMKKVKIDQKNNVANNKNENTPVDSLGSKSWFVIGLILISCYFLLKASIAQLLWNWFMPALFGLPKLNVIKALAMLAISEVFIKQTIVDFSDLSDTNNLSFKKIQMRKALENLFGVFVVGFICKLILFGF